MDQQAATLLATLKRPAAPSDVKLTAFNALKSDIKHYRVPENAQATIFECVKLGVTQQASSSLAGAAFSTLGHLIKRLKIQDPTGVAITHLSPRLYAAITERLSDLREQIRSSASNALAEMWPFLAQDVERIIREDVIAGANVRAKETGMLWVARMHRDEQMPFKSFVSPMVACLEDADGTVRDAARNTLVDLFKDAPDRAKTDLKRQLKAHSVRHAIESQILAQIGATSATTAAPKLAAEHESELTSSTRSLPSSEHAAQLARSLESEAAQPPPPEPVQMDPLYVHSDRELNDIFRDMTPCFEGRETEQNWMPRDKAVLKIRRLLKGNAPQEHHQLFMTSLKNVMEGILKVANSLRTTMSSNGCQLVQELAQTLGPAIDHHVEILLQSFIKMSSATKHIASENGRTTCDAIFQHCSYHVRLMQHVWAAAQDKNVQTRQCTTTWLRTILKRQAGYKSHFESSGGLDLAEKCIRKGLDDANPKVKEATRATYWNFAKTWPERAESIMNKLDPKSRGMLEKDSNNPNAALFQSQASSSTSRPAITGRPSALKEIMAEQRRAKSAARNLPDRPNSAMASMTPARTRGDATSANRARSRLRNDTRTTSTTSNTSTATASAGTTSKGSSLMSGPVRRPKRAEIPRPLTADPYASRRMLRPETPSTLSPHGSPSKSTNASRSSIPTSSANRSRGGTTGSAASREVSPTVSRRAPTGIASRLNQSSRPTSKDSNVSSFAGDFASIREDDLLPSSHSHSQGGSGVKRPQSTYLMRSAFDRPTSRDGAVLQEDGEATITPSSSHRRNISQTLSTRSQSPELHRSSLKMMFDAARERLDRPTSSSSTQAFENIQHTDFNKARPAGSVASTSRASSPTKSAADVQIYEDPVREQDTAPFEASQQQVLSERTINENVSLQSPTQSNGSNGSQAGSPAPPPANGSVQQALSPNVDDAEILRNRRLLASGIQRIQGRTLDAHGFRKVQDLAKSTTDIWEGGAKFDQLISAILSYLPAFEQDTRLSSLSATKSHGLKVQALSVLRALLTVHPKLARSWYDRSLTAILVCRKQIDNTHDHVVADLERTAEEIIRLAPAAPCIDAVMEYLRNTAEQAESVDDTTSKAIAAATAMALLYLRMLVVASSTGNLQFDHERRTALTKLTAQYLEHSDAEVRKNDVDLASEVYALFDGAASKGDDHAEFWKHFAGVDDGRKGLLTYYIARKAKQQS